MSRRDKQDKPDGFWWEGSSNVPRGWLKGRAGKAPRGRLRDSNPRGWGRSTFKAGPTRGHLRSGHDKRGGWFFGRGQ